jgi:hypothetical protein
MGRLGGEGVLFGYALGEGLRAEAQTADVAGAVSAFTGRAARIRFSTPPPEPIPPSMEDVVVPGEWLQPLYRSDLSALAGAAARWAVEAATSGSDRLASAERGA